MDRSQFNRRHAQLNIGETELNRKYLAYLREQEDMQRMYEAVIASQRSSSSVAGGGSASSITEAKTILEYNTSEGASLVWNGVTFTLDTSLPNYSYTAIITTIPDTVGATMPSSPNLIGVTIGNTVVSIGTDAFFTCSALTSVTFTPTSTLGSIGLRSFEGCSTLASITIPNSVTSIGAYAFRICGVLASITIPNSVTSIGNYAFNFTNLTTVTIPNSVTSIGASAFANTPLTSITIPNSVTSIGDGAFEFCTVLATVTIANGQLVGILSPNPSQAFFGVTVETIPPTP